ncbi:MAG TPA: PAS domain S-box protein [Polyangiales bacterium]|nr:PAS domain S-box protein [Polyangiales bacterium]
MQVSTPSDGRKVQQVAKRVLVVDASDATRAVFRSVCADLVLHCVERDSSQPIALAQGESYSVAFVEARALTPELSAWLHALRGSTGCAFAPIVLISQAAPEDTAALVRQSAVDDFVSAPLSAAELRARIGMHLRLGASAAHALHREQALFVMLEITQALVSSHDIQEILYTVVRRIADVVEVDRVSIVLVPDDAAGSGYVVAASDDAALSNLRLDLQKYPEIRHVLQTREALRVDDVLTHPLLDGVRSSVTGTRLSSLTLLPMVFEGKVMGVLFIRAQHARGALDEQQVSFCQVLANATAIALRNARILQTLRLETQRDSHARAEAEKRISSLKRYADVFESAADGMVAIDERARLLYANPGAYALLGYDVLDFPFGSTVYRVVAPQDRARLRLLARGFGRGDYPRNVDLRIRRKNDQFSTINCSFSSLHGEDGAVLLTFRDVTEARKLEAELVHTRNFLQSLIDASVDAIVAADMSGTIILFNERAQTLYGYRAEDVIQKLHVKALYPGNGAKEVGRMLRSRAGGGVGRLEPVRMEAIDSSGNIFPISLSAATIYEHGLAVATFGIFTDLRERVRVEEQLAQAQEKLALTEKQALLAELAGATAHELNQPLTSVMGYAELLMRKVGELSPAFRAAEVIHNEAQRMAEIVRKIGKLTRYETKSYVGEQRILDLDRAAADEPDPNRGNAGGAG